MKAKVERVPPVGCRRDHVDVLSNMSFFFDKFDDQPEQPESQRGKACFEPAPVVGMNTIAITISQEQGGSPSLRYWFTAVGADKETVINYLLELFDDTAGAMFMGEWRPAPDETSPIPTTATFTGWEMSMNSGGKKTIACTDSGDFISGVEVTVLNTTDLP